MAQCEAGTIETVAKAGELARDAARTFGSDESRLRVELALVQWHLEHGRPTDARDLITRARADFPAAERTFPELLRLELLLAREQADLAQLERVREECITRLDALIRVERRGLEEPATWHDTADPGELLAFHLAIASEIEGQFGGALVDLGLLELAAAAFDRGEQRALEVPEESPYRAGALIQSRMNRLLFLLGTEQHSAARTLAAQPFEPGIELTTEEETRLRLHAAIASAEESRASARVPAGLAADVERLAEAAGTAHEDRRSALLLLVDLDLRAGAYARARERLGALERLGPPAEFGGSHRGRLEVQARSAAFRVRLALADAVGTPDHVSAHAELRARVEQLLEEARMQRPRRGGLGLFHWGTLRLALTELMFSEIALLPGEAGIERALDRLVHAQSAGTLARELHVGEGLDWSAARDEFVRGGSGVLVLVPSMERSLLVLADDTGLQAVTLGSRDAILAAVSKLQGELRQPPRRGDDERTARLDAFASVLEGELRLTEIGERVRKWKRILVVGAELCNSLPLECVRLDGRWLGSSHAISYLPSLPVGVALARRARGRTHAAEGLDCVLLTSPTLLESVRVAWPRQATLLLSSEDEEALVASFSPERTLVLRGEQASSAGLERPEVRGADVLCVLTHGVYSDGVERPAAILLAPGAADDGVVRSDHIESLTSTPALVLLYACGTARGPLRMGDDTGAHLGASFLRQGSDAVLVSRGDVSLRAMVALGSAFHAALAAGHVPDEALRLARAELASRPETSDPFHFGLVSLTGLADRRTFQLDSADGARTSSTPRWWIGIGVLALAALGIAARRRFRT